MYHMCKMFNRLPSDSFFEEMDPIEKLWLYESWMHEIELEHELHQRTAILTGSFSNPQAAQDYVKQLNPDFALTDEEFDESLEMVRRAQEKYIQEQAEIAIPQTEIKKRRKQKRKLIRDKGR